MFSRFDNDDRPTSCEKCKFGVCDHDEFWGSIVERWSCGTESGACVYDDENEKDDEELEDEDDEQEE